MLQMDGRSAFLYSPLRGEGLITWFLFKVTHNVFVETEDTKANKTKHSHSKQRYKAASKVETFKTNSASILKNDTISCTIVKVSFCYLMDINSHVAVLVT